MYSKDLKNRFKDHSELKASLASTRGEMDTIKQDLKRVEELSRVIPAHLNRQDEQLRGKERELARREQEYKVLVGFVEGRTNFCMGCGKLLDKVSILKGTQGRVKITLQECAIY